MLANNWLTDGIIPIPMLWREYWGSLKWSKYYSDTGLIMAMLELHQTNYVLAQYHIAKNFGGRKFRLIDHWQKLVNIILVNA